MRNRVFLYVQQRLRAGDPPSVREIRDHVGLRAAQSVQRHLDALVNSGQLERNTSGRSRALRLPSQLASHVKPVLVPLLGQVQAGQLTTAVEAPEGFIAVTGMQEGDGLFALRVSGLSMERAGILPGDVVIVRRQADAEDGDIVVALVEDEATVKRLRRQGGQVRLEPENPDFEVIIPDPEQVRLLGKVVEVRRYLEGMAGRDA